MTAETAVMPNDSLENTERREAFSRLVVEHHSGLRSYVGSLGVATSSVDDIAHEALLVAFRKYVVEGERIDNFCGWIRGIAKRVLANDRRKSVRRYAILNETVTEFLISRDPADDLSEDEERQRRRQALRHCMQSLSEQNRQIVTARYHNESAAKSIGEELDMKPEAIRQRLLTARRALRKCVAKKLGGDW